MLGDIPRIVCLYSQGTRFSMPFELKGLWLKWQVFPLVIWTKRDSIWRSNTVATIMSLSIWKETKKPKRKRKRKQVFHLIIWTKRDSIWFILKNDVATITSLSIWKETKILFPERTNKQTNNKQKVSQAIGVIYRISSFVPYRCLRTLYFSLIQSRLAYGITAWGGAAIVHIDKLLNLQNRFNSLLIARNSHQDSTVNFLTVYKLFAYFCSVKFYRSFELELHTYFTCKINSLLPVHSYGTRLSSNNLLNTPLYHNTRCQQFFL